MNNEYTKRRNRTLSCSDCFFSFLSMFFSKKKTRNKYVYLRHAETANWRIPSRRDYSVRIRRSGIAKNPLVHIKTPRLTVSRLRLFLAKLAYYTLFSLFIAGVSYFLFFSEWLEINNVTVEGNRNVDKKDILDTIEPYLHKKRFYLFSSNNFFWVPRKSIEEEIVSNYKKISSAKVEKFLPHSLVVTVEEKKAVLLFCNNKGCIWVDEEGEAYNFSSHTEALASGSDVVIVQDDSQSDFQVGQFITTPQYVDYVNQLARKFPEKTQKEIAFFSTPLPSAEEIRVNTKEGWLVYFDINLDLAKSMDLLDEIVKEEFQRDWGKTTCFEYVDLRVVDKIFYRMKENCGGTSQEQLPAENKATAQENNSGESQGQIGTSNTKNQDTKKEKKKKKKNN